MRMHRFLHLFPLLLTLALFGCGGSSSEGRSSPSGIFLPDTISIDLGADGSDDRLSEFDFETLDDGMRLTITVSAEPEILMEEVGAEELELVGIMQVEVNNDGNPVLTMSDEGGDGIWEKKEVFSYDDEGNLIEETGYEWHTDEFVAEDKDEYSYDANGYLIEEINWNYNKSTEQLVKQWKSVYTNDDHGNPTLREEYDWVGDPDTGAWGEEPDETAYRYTYDGDNITKKVIDSNNDEVDDSKYEYTYDLSGRLIDERYSYNNSGEWVNCDREEFAFNEHDDLILAAYYRWSGDQVTGDWEIDDQENLIYTYDSNGNASQIDGDEDGDEITDHQAFLTWQRVDVPDALAALAEDMTAYEWIMMSGDRK